MIAVEVFVSTFDYLDFEIYFKQQSIIKWLLQDWKQRAANWMREKIFILSFDFYFVYFYKSF